MKHSGSILYLHPQQGWTSFSPGTFCFTLSREMRKEWHRGRERTRALEMNDF